VEQNHKLFQDYQENRLYGIMKGIQSKFSLVITIRHISACDKIQKSGGTIRYQPDFSLQLTFTE
jgi:hypothetical protein